jgi:hypothetical protein
MSHYSLNIFRYSSQNVIVMRCFRFACACFKLLMLGTRFLHTYAYYTDIYVTSTFVFERRSFMFLIVKELEAAKSKVNTEEL